MSFTEQYKEIVKEFYAVDSHENAILSFEDVAKKIGYSFLNHSKTTNEVCKEIERQISDVLRCSTGNGVDSSVIHSVIDQLYIDEQFEKNTGRNGLEELQYILDICKFKEFHSFTNNTKWNNAFELIQYKRMLGSLSTYHPTNRILRLVKCIHFFKKNGWRYTCEDGTLKLEDESVFVKTIDKSIRCIGVENVLKWLFNELSYCSKTQTFCIKRNASVVPSDESQIPYGFLLNRTLALASTGNFYSSISNKQPCYDKLTASLLHFTSYLNLLPNNPYETIVSQGLTLDVLQHWIQYDWLVDMLQYSYFEIISFMKHLASDVELNDFVTKKFGYSLKDYSNACEDIFFNVSTRSLSKLSSCEIECFYEKNVCDQILQSHSSKVDEINKNFKSYSDVVLIDYYFKPFIEIQKDSYVALPRPLAAIGLYESIAEKIRNGGFKSNDNQKFDGYLGHIVEEYVEKILRNVKQKCPANFNFYLNEKYQIEHEDRTLLKIDSESGECDFIIETNRKIYFLEIKKKNLCRKAYDGKPLDAYVDLAKSLYASQIQSLRHELLLRKNGKLCFDSQQTIVLGDKEVIRLTLTLFDFKSLQSKIFTQNLLINSLNKQLVSSNGVFSKDLKDVNDAFNELNNLVQKGISNKLLNQQYKFHNVCWLNVFQLSTIAKICDEKVSFDDVISKIIHSICGYYNNLNDYLALE